MSQPPPSNTRGSGPSVQKQQPNMVIDTASNMEADLAPVPSTTKFSRVICCEIKGTLNGFSMMGPDTATWRPTQNGHASVFGVDDLYNSGMTSSEHETPSIMHTADLAVANQILQNATITGATVLQSYSTFPVALGVSISCLPKNEVVETGEKYTFTTLPNTSINHPYVLYEAAEEHEEARRWTALYPAFNSNNLEEQDVLTINNCPFVFVHENHPVIELLRLNKHVLNKDIDEMEKMDNQWYKVTRSIMQEACGRLRRDVLSKMAPTQDLNKFSVQLSRLGGVEWSHVEEDEALATFEAKSSWSAEELRKNLEAHKNNFVQKPGKFMARIKLDYELKHAA